MTTIYNYDSDRISTGIAKEIGEAEGYGSGWTTYAPPPVPAGKFARLFGKQWTIVDERPAPRPPDHTARIEELKRLLSDTDYVAMPDYDKDKPDVLAQRQLWREEIRSLEGS